MKKEKVCIKTEKGMCVEWGMPKDLKDKINPHLLFGLELKIYEICTGKETMPVEKLKQLRQILFQEKQKWVELNKTL